MCVWLSARTPTVYDDENPAFDVAVAARYRASLRRCTADTALICYRQETVTYTFSNAWNVFRAPTACGQPPAHCRYRPDLLSTGIGEYDLGMVDRLAHPL